MTAIVCAVRGCSVSDDWRRVAPGSQGNLRGFINGLIGTMEDGHRAYKEKTVMELYQDISAHQTVFRLTGDHLASDFFEKLVLQKQSDGSLYELDPSAATLSYNGTTETAWTWSSTTDVWTTGGSGLVVKII